MPSDERLAIPPVLSNLGLFAAMTSRVPAATCAGSGAAIFNNEPSNCFALNVPLALAVFPSPFRLRTRRSPEPSMATAEGNHPVGIDPSILHLLADRLITAMASLPPQAT